MSRDTLSNRVNLLFQQGKWVTARKLLEEEREKDPTDHWVLTQLGVTFYEQRRYQEALQLFLASLKIVRDCPLTLWNAAGALDSLARHDEAVHIYTWLLRAKTLPKKDPCWESKGWADALKADCVYRLGRCFEHLGKREVAKHCYHQYMNLLATGIEGTYSVDDVLGRVRSLSGNAGTEGRNKGLRDAIKSTLTAVEPKPKKRSDARQHSPAECKRAHSRETCREQGLGQRVDSAGCGRGFWPSICSCSRRPCSPVRTSRACSAVSRWSLLHLLRGLLEDRGQALPLLRAEAQLLLGGGVGERAARP